MIEKEYFEKIKSYKLIANKSLGQNFLINPQTAEKIVNLLTIKEGDHILEIGSGLGSLSYFLAKSSANSQLIDVDERMLMFLNDEFKDAKNIEVKRQNILKHDLTGFNKIIGNLPYYITSGIIEKLLLDAKDAEVIVLMTQKEVYPKLLSSNKSPLSLFLNYVADISSPIEVGRNNFAPVPHVDSVVFVLTPNENIKNKENEKLFKVMKQLFLLRRKNILNNLSNLVKNKEKAREILEKMGIDTNKRPEELSIEFYINLLKML
jgi:16S rRNA (adenine1518-N6/adenine1519-N6)-dimethyltransferase